MITMHNILVATDFSETSDSALEYGRALARNFGARLHVLHVVEMSLGWGGVDGVGYNLPAIQDAMTEDARKKLDDIVGPASGQPPETIAVVKVAPGAAFVIAEYAKQAQVDLIVMGTHGRGLVGHLFLGSVAERVVRIAPCPVLTLRSPEHEFVLPDALQVVSAARV
jgi:nucleotide-binding universal stress UspA family protein